MEAIYSSETSVDFQRTTGHYMPENRMQDKYFCTYTLVCSTQLGVRIAQSV
jgi:hypothetical protein